MNPLRLPLVIAIFSCVAQLSSAATFGNYTYSDNGTSIKITEYLQSSSGAVNIPSTIDGKPVTELGKNSFFACQIISSVSIPSSVTKIGEGAFAYCTALKSVTIPASVESIGKSAFENCWKLKTAPLPDGLLDIGAAVFNECKDLETANIPSGLTQIPDAMFSGCGSLQKIVIPPSVTIIGESSFLGLYRVRHMLIPDGVTTIGTGAFAYCGSLKHVTIPPSVTTIGRFAFFACAGLSQITIPSSVRTIGPKAFAGCGLEHLTLNGVVTTIEEGVFEGCGRLNYVTIPSSVTSIEKKAFEGCLRLSSIVFMGDAPTIGIHVFRGVAPDFKVFYSKGSKGFTRPTWHSKPSSKFAPEIAVQLDDGNFATDGETVQKFGTHLVGTRGSVVTFTIKNVGPLKLKGLFVETHGANSADFVIKSMPKVSLASDRSTTFRVAFKPSAIGKRHATIRIKSNDGDEYPFSIKLVGHGIETVN